jgi:hypothetical protein
VGFILGFLAGLMLGFGLATLATKSSAVVELQHQPQRVQGTVGLS